MEKPKTLYHYTTLEALKGILNVEKKELTFWGTRHDSMNDPQDYTFASKVVVPKMLLSIKDMEELTEEENEYIEEIPYIVSFTENRDSDFMWEHYKAEVALEIDTAYLNDYMQEKGNNNITSFFGKCEYANESEIDDIFIKKWKESQVYLPNLPSMAQYVSVFIKRDAFSPEKEWRLYSSAARLCMVTPQNGVDNVETSDKLVKVKCVREHDVILYMEFAIPADALKGIIINTADVNHYHKVKKHIEVLLSQKGISPKTISIRQTSKYPF